MKNTNTYIYLFCILLFLNLTVDAQQVPKARKATFALTNATIETVSQGRIQGDLLLKDGQILQIGPSLKIPADAEVIDCSGLTVYPGMIDGGTTLGLSEIGAIPVTQDANEIGLIKPHLQAISAINSSSVAIPVTRVSGVTSVLSAPRGGLIPGTASLIHLRGYTPDQMAAGFSPVMLNFPALFPDEHHTSAEHEKKALKKRQALNDFWDQAEQYESRHSLAQSNPEIKQAYSPELEAMLPVIRGEKTVMIEVNRDKDIEAAIKWVQERKLKAVFTGVAEGWRVAEQLAAAQIPVITGPILRMPSRSYDRYDKAYANAGIMYKAGVKVALRTNNAENVRNLPFHAGFAAAYGMGREAALKAVTMVPAEIFGLDDKIGSIEAGKNANLFVTNGDPFEPKTQVLHVFIDGWKIPMDSRHIRLYQEFLDRDGAK